MFSQNNCCTSISRCNILFIIMIFFVRNKNKQKNQLYTKNKNNIHLRKARWPTTRPSLNVITYSSISTGLLTITKQNINLNINSHNIDNTVAVWLCFVRPTRVAWPYRRHQSTPIISIKTPIFDRYVDYFVANVVVAIVGINVIIVKFVKFFVVFAAQRQFKMV